MGKSEPASYVVTTSGGSYSDEKINIIGLCISSITEKNYCREIENT